MTSPITKTQSAAFLNWETQRASERPSAFPFAASSATDRFGRGRLLDGEEKVRRVALRRREGQERRVQNKSSRHGNGDDARVLIGRERLRERVVEWGVDGGAATFRVP
ncbi:hypothetical protein MTO96_030323 [Rhipicephalus appendiculatus]